MRNAQKISNSTAAKTIGKTTLRVVVEELQLKYLQAAEESWDIEKLAKNNMDRGICYYLQVQDRLDIMDLQAFNSFCTGLNGRYICSTPSGKEGGNVLFVVDTLNSALAVRANYLRQIINKNSKSF